VSSSSSAHSAKIYPSQIKVIIMSTGNTKNKNSIVNAKLIVITLSFQNEWNEAGFEPTEDLQYNEDSPTFKLLAPHPGMNYKFTLVVISR